jgi:hypothetical protein
MKISDSGRHVSAEFKHIDTSVTHKAIHEPGSESAGCQAVGMCRDLQETRSHLLTKLRVTTPADTFFKKKALWRLRISVPSGRWSS